MRKLVVNPDTAKSIIVSYKEASEERGLMLKYVALYNPELIKLAIKLAGSQEDNLSVEVCKQLSTSEIARIDKSLAQQMLDSIKDFSYYTLYALWSENDNAETSVIGSHTEDFLAVNSPYDIYEMDISQNNYFFSYHENSSFQDDYILNSKYEVAGRALRKGVYNAGYSINSKDQIEFYFFKISDDKLVCFPLNLNFEQQIYKTYYDRLLIESDLDELPKIELNLLVNTILLKNNGTVENEKIRDVLSVYSFVHEYSGQKSSAEVVSQLQGAEKQNFELLKSMLN